MPNENEIFWSNLEKIQIILLKSDEDFASYLGLSLQQFLKDRNQKKFLPLLNVFEVAEKLNFHFEDLLNPLFKLQAETNDYDLPALPTRYRPAAYTSTKPILNILNYLEKQRGLRAKINLYRKFQLTEEFIFNEKSRANIFLMSDIVQYLAKTFELKQHDFINIGQSTPFVSSNSTLKKTLSAPHSIYQVVEYFFDEGAQTFDRNFHYQIESLNTDYAIINAMPRKQVVEELDVPLPNFGNEYACFTRQGVISSISWFKYQKNIPIKKISCIYNGDRSSRYLLELSSFKKLSRFSNDALFSQSTYQ